MKLLTKVAVTTIAVLSINNIFAMPAPPSDPVSRAADPGLRTDFRIFGGLTRATLWNMNHPGIVAMRRRMIRRAIVCNRMRREGHPCTGRLQNSNYSTDSQ